ncbi:S-layer homology domain-containing protein [Paenibacillus sacheonensis]|uniref:SLH domain-containing protein n=1 Tax=Paenibacillus sacheonensis TaxID=742054 RepID=A0A7X5BWP2_9BACL|nr:S-layer homology domain-containing protein [Paenibacillus sacheonensis]MBM7564189.1 hypothetical protein [Paenibacillus sacheonensis]NBC67486.1 hypothetical protein [Paenibacillus sacheonensis]
MKRTNSRTTKLAAVLAVAAMLASTAAGGLRPAYADAADNDNVLKITQGAGVISHGWNKDDLIPGHTYAYSFEAMGTGTTNAFVQYNWEWDKSLSYTDLAGSRTEIDPSATWKTYTGEFTAPAAPSGGEDFYFGAATDGSVFVDNVVITDTGAEQGGTFFADDFTSGLDGWYTEQADLFSVVPKSEAVGPAPTVQDNDALKVAVGSGNMSWGSNKFAANATYTYSFEAMGSGTADIRLQTDEKWDTPWSTVTGTDITVGPSTGWTTYTATFTTPANQPTDAGYYLFLNAASAGPVYINNLTVTDEEGKPIFAEGFENLPDKPAIGKGHDSWYTGTNGIFTVVPVGEAAGSSSKALKIASGSGNVTASLGALAAGHTYTLSLEGIGYSSADFNVENKSWATLSQLSVAASDTWKDDSVTFVVPDDDQNDYTLVVNTASSREMYADNVVITDITDANAPKVQFQEDFEQVAGEPALGKGGEKWYTATDGTLFTVVPRIQASGVDPNASAIVDKYGQIIASPYTPNDSHPHAKVTSDDELAAVPAQNEAYFGSLTPPTNRDTYGGLTGSKETFDFEATGFFYTDHADVDNDGTPEAVMVDPLGNLYFQLGATVTDPNETYADLTGIKSEYDQLPAYDPDSKAWRGENTFSPYVYNIEQQTGEPFDVDAWREDQIHNEKQLGFNSLGMWSGEASTTTPYFEVLDGVMGQTPHIGSSRLFDVFSPDWQSRLDAAYGAAVSGHADDPMLIGYMFENELPYDSFNGTLLGSSAVGSGTRNELAAWMSGQYDGDIDAFNAAWGTNFASFDDLKSGTLKLNTTAASTDINNFTKHYLETEYHTIYETGKSHDPQHMQLGDRWFAGSLRNAALAQDLAEATAGNVDAITYNYYTNSLDTNWLKQIYAWSGNTPIILSEWHYSDTSVLPNGSQPVSSPTAQGQMYSDYLENAIATGVVVGSDWFTWLDQAPTGRYFNGPNNGESGAYGFVDVTNRPVVAFDEYAKQTHYNVYDLLSGSIEPYAAPNRSAATDRDTHKALAAPQTDAAPVIGDFADWSDFSATAALTAIDQVSGPAIPDPNVSAKMSIAWDDENFYYQARVTSGNDRIANGGVSGNGADMWNGDGVELYFGPQDVDATPGSMLGTDSQLLLGVNKNADSSVSAAAYWVNGPSFADQTPVNVKAELAPDGKGWILEAAIPLSAIGLPADAFGTDGSLAIGTPMRYDMGFDLSGAGGTRYSQYAWNGNDSDSKNRNPWGKLSFAAQAEEGGNGTGGNNGNNNGSGTGTGSGTDIGSGIIKPTAPVLNPASGEATADVPASAFAQLPSSADKVRIQVPKIEGATGYVVNLPADVLSAAERNRMIIVETGAGTITIPATMLRGIDLHGAATVAIVIAQAETSKLGDELKASIGDRPVIDVSLRANGKELPWSNPAAPVTVAVPYKPAADEAANSGHITVWHIGADGRPEPVVHAAYDAVSGTVGFQTTHFSTYAVVYVEKHFGDLGRYGWAKDAIETLASKGAIEGVSAAAFAPSANITRADYVLLLARTLGLSEAAASNANAAGDGNFADVKPGSYYYEAVGAAKALGIAIGSGGNSFHPQASITRQEMMTLTARALTKLGKLNASGGTNPLDRFADRADVSGYAAGGVSALLDAGLIQGADGKLNPLAEATRAEAAVFLYNAFRL